MEAKEIERRSRTLSKAIEQGEPSGTLISLLNELCKEIKPSEDLLRSTRIGIVVGRLRQHKDPKVAQLATSIVNKWRSDIRRDQMAGGSSPHKANQAATSASATSMRGAPGKIGPTKLSRTSSGSKPNTGSNLLSKPSSVTAKSTENGATSSPSENSCGQNTLKVPPHARSCLADGVDYQVTNDSARNSCIRLMYDALAVMTEEAPESVKKVAVAVEAACFELFKSQTSADYRGKMRSLYQNLKNKSNPGLRMRVLLGEVSAWDFVRFSDDELKSDQRRQEDAAFQRENMNKAMVAQVEKSISASLTCGRCHQKKVSYFQAQTRSADEPMTTFCECVNCGHRWKFS